MQAGKAITLLLTTTMFTGGMTLVGAESKVDLEKASRLHESVITLDSHVDFSLSHFTPEKNPSQYLEGIQVDLPKMRDGGLDAAFFIVYVSQTPLSQANYEAAYQKAVAKLDGVQNLTSQWAPESIDLALEADDVTRIVKAGKKVAVIGVENAFPIGTDLNRVDEFYNRGARYVGIMHNGHNQFGDSNLPRGYDVNEKYGGLSPLGFELGEKLNDKGIVVDISHASKKTRLDIIRASKTPVVDSHSALSIFYDHPRNIDDEILEALVNNGGVVQIVAFQSYLARTPPEKLKAINQLAKRFGFPEGNMWTEGNRVFSHFPKASMEARMGYWTGFQKLEKSFAHASVKHLVNQVDYVVKKFGVDYVGISSDFGGGGGIGRWQDASQTFNVTLELIRRGYSDEEIRKIWSGNYLRVWKQVEDYSRKN